MLHTDPGTNPPLWREKWREPSPERRPVAELDLNRHSRLLPRSGEYNPGLRRERNGPRSGKRQAEALHHRRRVAVEREFGRLKHDYGLAPLRVRGLERVALHADLVMLARLGQALVRTREMVALAA